MSQGPPREIGVAEMGAALQAVLDDMQHTVDQLALALDAERAAVHALSSDALNDAGTEKQTLLQRLEQLDIERRQLTRVAPTVATNMAGAWAHIVQSLRDCQQLNQRNGSAVNQRLTQVREALSILTGHAGEGGLYDRAGELRASLRSQVLAAV